MKMVYQFDKENAADVKSMIDAFHYGFKLIKIQEKNKITEFTLKKGK